MARLISHGLKKSRLSRFATKVQSFTAGFTRARHERQLQANRLGSTLLRQVKMSATRASGYRHKQIMAGSEVEELVARPKEEVLKEKDFQELAQEAGKRKLQQYCKPEMLSEAQKTTILEETEPEPSDIIQAVLRHHAPFLYGALVYSFTEDSEGRPMKADWVFGAAAPIGSSSYANPTDSPSTPGDSSPLGRQPSHETRFPMTLKPFNLIPAAELNHSTMAHHIVIDLDECTYRITKPTRQTSKWPPQVSTLFSLYQDPQPFVNLLLPVETPEGSKKFTAEALYDKNVDQLRRL